MPWAAIGRAVGAEETEARTFAVEVSDAIGSHQIVNPLHNDTLPMTLHFQMRREDVLAFNREYHAASPTYQRMRTRVRFMLPLVMLCFWLFALATDGFNWVSTTLYLAVSVLWFFLFPARFDRRVQRYTEKFIDEGSFGRSLGPCELTLSESGLHSKSSMGESTFKWSSVDRVLLTDSYLFIFLTGPIGYPILLADVGQDAAKAAYDYALSHHLKTA